MNHEPASRASQRKRKKEEEGFEREREREKKKKKKKKNRSTSVKTRVAIDTAAELKRNVKLEEEKFAYQKLKT